MNILFTFSGVVKKNLGRGRTLGYPTANIDVPHDYPEGIFVGTTQIDNVIYPSLVFIGPSITFGETDKKAEVFILDFQEDLYSKNLIVNVLQKLRDNMKFDTMDGLVAQMKIDEAAARAFFKSPQIV